MARRQGRGRGSWSARASSGAVSCSATRAAGEGRVRLFLLARELRGQGLGRRLLDELLAEARAAGYERLTLSTFSDLRAAAHLYREAGFRVVREETTPRWGRERFTYQHYELRL